MYYQSMLSAALVDRLHAANVLVSTVELGVEPTMALAKARAALTHAVSLAVIDGNPSLLEPILAEREVAFIEFNQIESRCSRHAVQSVAVRRDAVLLALRDHCLACGVRRVLQVTDPKPSFDVGPTLRNAGLIVDDLLFNDLPGYGSPERVERGALEAVERWLATGPTLPDLIWFGDDFAARGALLAMASRGLRIPEDVQVISWANKGLGPVFSKPLTRVEMDPIAQGEALAQCVLDRLGGLHGKPVELVPAFIEGATTRKR